LIAVEQTSAFYRTALLGLVALEQRQPTTRRFGPDADAAWSMFHGHLDAGDRIDLLIRDAGVKHPAVFAPRTVFSFADIPEDEPFGPTWRSPFGRDTGRAAWRETLALRDLAPHELWTRALAAWGVRPEVLELRSRLDLTSRVLVVGTTAIAALADRFLAERDLDWGRQVVAVAEDPAGLQLAGLVPVICGARDPARVVAVGPGRAPAAFDAVAGLGFARADIAIGTRTPSAAEIDFVDQLRAART
jgi:hypothetical protein